jgi:hypothetical protein
VHPMRGAEMHPARDGYLGSHSRSRFIRYRIGRFRGSFVIGSGGTGRIDRIQPSKEQKTKCDR